MTIVAPDGSRELMERALPVSLSPDGYYLVFIAAPDNLVGGLYIRRLEKGEAPRRLTNIGILQSAGPLPTSFIPTLIDSVVTWRANSFRYVVPNEGTFEVNILTGEVVRE